MVGLGSASSFETLPKAAKKEKSTPFLAAY